MELKIKTLKGIKYVALHHTGGTLHDKYASTQYLTASQIDGWHKNRWAKKYPNFKSSLNYWGGYNAYIDEDGDLTQFRMIGEETGGAIGHNFDTVHICLAGNFLAGVNKPTERQLETLRELLLWLVTQGLSSHNIVPHRFLQSTVCNGNLPNDWGQKLLREALGQRISLLQSLVVLYTQLLQLMKRKKGVLAGTGKSCLGIINK